MIFISIFSLIILILNIITYIHFGFSIVSFILTAFSILWILTIYLQNNRHKSNIYKHLSTLFWIGTISSLIIFLSCQLGIYKTAQKGYNLSDEDLSNIDQLIVLGAGLWNGDQLSPSLRYRMETTLAILNSNEDLSVIVSGGQGSDESISEAKAMGQFLINNEISKNRIIYESKSTSTLENIYYSKEIILTKNKKLPSIGIISSDFHLFRAMMIAKKLEFEAYPISSPVPNSLKFTYRIREFPAIIIDFFRTLFK